VRHDRRAEHAGGEQHRVGALEARHDAGQRLLAVDSGEEQPGDEADDDHGQQRDDDHLEGALPSPRLHSE